MSACKAQLSSFLSIISCYPGLSVTLRSHICLILCAQFEFGSQNFSVPGTKNKINYKLKIFFYFFIISYWRGIPWIAVMNCSKLDSQ